MRELHKIRFSFICRKTYVKDEGRFPIVFRTTYMSNRKDLFTGLHLNAVVKRQKQKTAIAFLYEQINYEAQSLLSQTELTIKEIAFRLGFADSAHFNHFFKKQTGRTPALFRKERNN